MFHKDIVNYFFSETYKIETYDCLKCVIIINDKKNSNFKYLTELYIWKKI